MGRGVVGKQQVGKKHFHFQYAPTDDSVCGAGTGRRQEGSETGRPHWAIGKWMARNLRAALALFARPFFFFCLPPRTRGGKKATPGGRMEAVLPRRPQAGCQLIWVQYTEPLPCTSSLRPLSLLLARELDSRLPGLRRRLICEWLLCYEGRRLLPCCCCCCCCQASWGETGGSGTGKQAERDLAPSAKGTRSPRRRYPLHCLHPDRDSACLWYAVLSTAGCRLLLAPRVLFTCLSSRHLIRQIHCFLFPSPHPEALRSTDHRRPLAKPKWGERGGGRFLPSLRATKPVESSLKSHPRPPLS